MAIGGGPGGRIWARSARRRWLALAALGLLAGVTAGLAGAAVAGARRSDAAWDRLRAVSLASDAIIFTSQAGIHDDSNWDEVAAQPFVAAAGAFGFASFAVLDDDGQVVDPSGSLLVSQYGDFLTEVDRPRIIEGRLPDPGDPDEIVAEESTTAADPNIPTFHVGDELPVRFFAGDRPDGDQGPPTGAEATLRVVGIARSPFAVGAIPSTAGGLFAGPAFRAAHPEAVAAFSNLVVRLRDPETDIRRLEAEVNDLYPGRGVPVYDLDAAAKRITNGTGLEASGLLLFAAAVAIAGTVIVGQALTRSVRAAGGDLATLGAVGLDRRDRTGALILPHLVSVGVAVASAVVLAIALSPWFPIGLGRRVDPDVGIHVDLLVVGGLALALTLLLGGAVAATAWRMAGWRVGASVERSSRIVLAVQRSPVPVTVALGSGLAFDAGRGSRALPTRSAVAAAVVGVLGAVGGLVFLGGLDDAAAHGERFGAVWDIEASFEGDEPGESYFGLPDTMAADPDVLAVARIGRMQAPLSGQVVPYYAIEPRAGDGLSFVTLEGRAPTAAGEIAVGPDTADVLGIGVGDDVTVGDGITMRVVGLSLLPTTPHSSFDQGAWIVADDIPRAIPDSVRASIGPAFGVDLSDDEIFTTAFYLLGFDAASVRDGADVEAVAQRIAEAAGPDIAVTGASPPADQTAMHNVRALPILFAVFAPLIALAALLHVTSSVLRRRGTDLAVLRSIGLTPRQSGACLTWQATLLATAGILIGIPLGLVVGRAAWRIVAEHVPMVHVVPAAAIPILLLVPVALLAANLAGARPAWRAAHASPVARLRAD